MLLAAAGSIKQRLFPELVPITISSGFTPPIIALIAGLWKLLKVAVLPYNFRNSRSISTSCNACRRCTLSPYCWASKVLVAHLFRLLTSLLLVLVVLASFPEPLVLKLGLITEGIASSLCHSMLIVLKESISASGIRPARLISLP